MPLIARLGEPRGAGPPAGTTPMSGVTSRSTCGSPPTSTVGTAWAPRRGRPLPRSSSRVEPWCVLTGHPRHSAGSGPQFDALGCCPEPYVLGCPGGRPVPADTPRSKCGSRPGGCPGTPTRRRGPRRGLIRPSYGLIQLTQDRPGDVRYATESRVLMLRIWTVW